MSATFTKADEDMLASAVENLRDYRPDDKGWMERWSDARWRLSDKLNDLRKRIALTGAQPAADSAMEVLRELEAALMSCDVSGKGLAEKIARVEAARCRARTLSAASNKEIDRGL